MKSLPSLNGLRAFETAARCGNFVLAGEELGVSSAAVSLHVKSLEEHLGKKLFVRKGNRISLTDAGEEMYPRLARAFEELIEATQVAPSENRGRHLVISVLPALSERWFLPRVLAFRAQTGMSLDIRVQEDPIEFEREAVDLRLTYGSTFYPGYREATLFSGVAVPVCAPSFLSDHGDPDGSLRNVPDRHLIHNRWGPNYASEPNWSDWRRRAGWKSDVSPAPSLVFSDLSLAIATARQGAGVALVPSALIEGDLAEGTLVMPSEISLPMKKDYVCVYPHARADAPSVQAFRTHFGI